MSVIAGTCYRLEGQGDPLVLIHGVGLDQHMWAAQSQALAPLFSVLRYDLYGHGQSVPAPAAVALGDYVSQLDSLLSDLEIGPCVVIGFSLGALIARGFVRAYPARVTRLVILNGIFRRNRQQREAVRARLASAEQSGPAVIIDAAIERWFSPQFRASHPGVIAIVRKRLEENDPAHFLAAYRLFAEAGGELDAALPRISVPTLVMTGELDSGSTPLMARHMAAALAHSELCVLPGQRHMMAVEAAPQVNRVLLEFLSARGVQ